jgi:hypothetical protein
MWPDVGRQLASLLEQNVFGCLLRTPSYTAFLRTGGVSEPFERYTRYKPEPFPEKYAGTCGTYASLIIAQVKRLDALVEDRTLTAEVIHGPTKLYRVMHSRSKGFEPQDLRRGTSYFGDWWFSKQLLDDCILRCRALAAERQRNPALTEMTPDRCLRALFRRRLAIRIDWNAVQALRELVLEPNESIPVITGIGLPQRIYSVDANRARHPNRGLPASSQMLPGGDRQYWLPWTPQKSIRLWTPKGGFGPNAKL